MSKAGRRQAASAVLMIRPSAFGYNIETAQTNVFQHEDNHSTQDEIHESALAEFDAFAEKLKGHGVRVLIFRDEADPRTPDAIFPNNWVSFHANGDVVLYPMLAKSRRAEVRSEILEQLASRHGFRVRRVIDLTDPEVSGGVLEGTGSLVLDHVNRQVFAACSARTHAEAVRRFGDLMRYETVIFETVDTQAVPLYHTNVLMTLGDSFAIICMQAIADEQQRDAVRRRLQATGRAIVEISADQMNRFAGNMLQVTNDQGDSLLVASTQAYDSLEPPQKSVLESFCTPVLTPLPTIERIGGGSARCMLAEVFLPAR